jgi:hypothetical protein
MSFNFSDNSRKLGRMIALNVILIIAGIISIMGAADDPKNIIAILSDWIKLAMIAVTFYFLDKQKT